jgi:pimeloyl-ACP methyl ester carboxylesterase
LKWLCHPSEFHLSIESAAQTPHDQFLTWCLERPGVSHYADIAGVRSHYLEWKGPNDAPTLLLVHGFMGHAHWWDFIAPVLAQDYRVIAMDLSGMGDSGYRSEYSLELYIAEIAGMIQHIAGAPIKMVAHSFGGRCAILTAHAHPELLERIIVVDSHVGFADEERQRRFNRESRHEKKRYADLATAKSRFRLVPEEPGTLPLILDHIATHSLKQEEGAWVWKFDEAVMRNMTRPALTDAQALPHLKVPMDFVCGEHSVVAPLDHARKVAAAIPNGRGPIVIPAAHHHVPIGQPLALVSALRALLAE